MTRAEWREALGVALATMASQKLRSFLTMLGVVVGVASVISVAAIINGLNKHITEKVREIGSQTFFLTRFPAFTFDFDRMPEEIRLRKHFTAEDAVAIQENCPTVHRVSPILTRFGPIGGVNDVRYGSSHVDNAILRGGWPELVDVLPVYLIKEGRMHTAHEERHAARVAMLGMGVAGALFGPLDPIGREIRVNGIPFLVIGLFETHKGLFGGPGVDEFVIIPYRTFARMHPEIEEVILSVSVADPLQFDRAVDEATDLMRRRRNVPAHKPNDFEITSPDLLADLWEQLTRAIVALTMMVASIGLVVGGIGVMNIMLVSVTERTAEIGVRKAVGARKKDIGAQFLLEAVTLTGMGGLIGILMGVGLSVTVAAVVPDLPAFVSVFWTVMGMLMAIAVGLFSGIYPAVKAANLDPVRCLHYE